jgi:leader peptidase (prepilin peptidase)/N-methyltransferase
LSNANRLYTFLPEVVLVIQGLLIYLLIFFVGIVCAFLVNYLSDTLPVTRRFTQPVCHQCGNNYAWKDYMTFQKCSQCGHSFPIRNWLVLFVYPLAFVLLFAYSGLRINYWIGLVVLVYLGLVAVIDIEHHLVLNPISIAGVILFFFIGLSLHGVFATLLGGVVGFAIMFAFYFLGVLFGKLIARRRGEENNEPALGFGDVNLGGVLGLILGWPGITAGLLLAILSAGIISGIYLLISALRRSYRPFLAIPYAPFLILGALVLLFRP